MGFIWLTWINYWANNADKFLEQMRGVGMMKDDRRRPKEWRGAFNLIGLDSGRHFPYGVCNPRVRKHKGLKGFGFSIIIAGEISMSGIRSMFILAIRAIGEAGTIYCLICWIKKIQNSLPEGTWRTRKIPKGKNTPFKNPSRWSKQA